MRLVRKKKIEFRLDRMIQIEIQLKLKLLQSVIN